VVYTLPPDKRSPSRLDTDMNSDDLECFVQVASYGSISRAAIALGSEQSTVSRQIARLESYCQTRLFHRSGRGVVPTDAGKALLDHARKVSSALDGARRAIHSLSEQGPASLVIAAQPTIARMTFGLLGKALKSQFPKMRLRFVEGLGTHMVEWLTQGEVDIAILYLPAHPVGLKVDVLLREHVHLVVPASYTHLGPTFSIRDLAELPLILPSTPHGLRLLVESLDEQLSRRLNVVIECDGSVSLTKRLVEQECGCTILPLAAVSDEVAQGTLRTAQLVEPEVVREIAIATAQNRPPVTELWGITQTIRKVVNDTVATDQWPGAQAI
jgi:LysR family nitrogen assimilation transcriptional regulator